MCYSFFFDVIIVGGGHAGTEAAMASSKMGKKTLLLTYNLETIGQMSCNPAIGGIGKGHLVKEIDALGGVMAKAIDNAGIQFRILNSSKGPAVQATRAQADRLLYKKMIIHALENQPNLFFFQQTVEDLIIKNNHINGVYTQGGLKFFAKSVVLTNGTFLNGKIYVGLKTNYNGGRAGDFSSIKLGNRLRELCLKVNRLKTGTPPRIDKRSINFQKLEPQYGDKPIPFFSFFPNKKKKKIKQVACYLTYTNEKTHNIIKKNLHQSPVYTKMIDSFGPRYCPSIEDKVIRFHEKNSHQIFLEPEGLDCNEIYPNGISTSLPFDVQVKIIHSINGLENAHITRPGYAVEYDFFDPKNLKLSLENKEIHGLFFAGQINGTTGYEEAAAQGLLAGINAARFCEEKDSWVPRRDEAYIGVLIDDLTTMGTKEPYRMFTSRAEYRLMLREDNADLRLTEIGRKLGLINDKKWAFYNEKINNLEKTKQSLKKIFILPHSDNAKKIKKIFNIDILKKTNIQALLKRPEFSCKKIADLNLNNLDINSIYQIEIETKYFGYIDRQKEEVQKTLKNEKTILPENIKYEKISGLSKEVISILNKYKPNSIGQAYRISGITPSAISVLLIYLKKTGMYCI